MTIETQLRDTVPTRVPTLDHHDLQRRGRARTWTTRAVGGATTLALVAVAATLTLSTPRSGGIEVVGRGGASSATDTAGSDGVTPGAPSTSPTDTPRRADPTVVATWDGLGHRAAVTRLQRVLDDHPERPPDLASIEVHAFGDRDEVTPVPVGTTDFPVIDVSDPSFVTDGRFETPALLPTWDQPAARNALDSLAATDLFAYTGVATDARGRTVLEFSGTNVDQQIWVDPASGYTAGVRFGTVAAGPTTGPEDRVDADPHPTTSPRAGTGR